MQPLRVACWQFNIFLKIVHCVEFYRFQLQGIYYEKYFFVQQQKHQSRKHVWKQPIKYTYLGSQECPVSPDDEELEYCMIFRIPKIENLECATKLRVLGLRKNLIKRIEGLDKNTELEELELYDNRIRHIENISHLQNLVFLDLSFNRIKEI